MLLKKNLITLSCFFFLGTMAVRAQVTTQTFVFSGATQSFVVPPCVGTISLTVKGAQGGANAGNLAGGLGGTAYGILPVTVGNTLYITVGGMNGYNGGGLPGSSPCTSAMGGYGGGASDIRLNGTTLSNRVIVGAGGGGAGGNRSNACGRGTGGGGGGGYYGGGGGCGYPQNSTTVPTGGTQTAGGSGGVSTFSSGQNGSPGTLGFGGAGGLETSTNQSGANTAVTGGAGGGLIGGNGQQPATNIYTGQSGAGGSSYVSSILTNSSTTSGNVTGNGVIIMEYTFNGAGVIASASSLSICTGSTPTLTASNVLSYTWTPGGSNSTSITVSPTSNSSYTVQGTNSFGCISTSVLNVTVDPGLPVLTVANTTSASGGICPTKTVILTASGALSYTWAGGSIPVTNGVVFSPTSAVNYTVTGVNGCGTASAVTSVSVHPFPTVNPVASSPSVCSGGTITLTATGNATNYAWSGGSVPVGGGSFVPVSTTVYSVVGTSALSCTALATIPVTVYPTPINPPTANPALICIGGSSTLTATGASNYTWSSSSQTVNTASFVVSPNIGSTTYTITKANSSCYNTQMVTVVTNSLPTIFAIVTPTVVCALTPATLAVGGAQTYTWTSPGPPTYTFTGASPVVSPVGPSTFTVAASDGTCINTTTVFLNANPNPTIMVSASSSSICEGQSVSLTATGGINYNWTITGGATLTGASITHTPTTATAYNVTGDNSFGCTSGANQVVLVYPKPTLTVSTNKSLVCSGGSATLSATGANTYSWDPNANSVLTATSLVNPTALTSSAVMYTVQGTNSGTGCQNTQTVLVNVYIPTLTISGNTNTCAGGLITLNSSGGNIGSYNWNIGDGNPHPTSNISATLAAPGVFTLSANSTSLGVTCPATETIALGIYYNPTITAVPERTLICLKESVGITADGGISYNWSNNMTGPTITITPLSGIVANFTVTGTDANGCSSTATVQVKISGCTGLNEQGKSSAGVYIYPNPANGKFTIQTDKDLKLNLVNELGQLVRVIHLTESNHHEVNVTDLAEGVYFVIGQKDNLQIYQKIVVTK